MSTQRYPPVNEGSPKSVKSQEASMVNKGSPFYGTQTSRNTNNTATSMTSLNEVVASYQYSADQQSKQILALKAELDKANYANEDLTINLRTAVDDNKEFTRQVLSTMSANQDESVKLYQYFQAYIHEFEEVKKNTSEISKTLTQIVKNTPEADLILANKNTQPYAIKFYKSCILVLLVSCIYLCLGWTKVNSELGVKTRFYEQGCNLLHKLRKVEFYSMCQPIAKKIMYLQHGVGLYIQYIIVSLWKGDYSIFTE